MSHHGGLPAQFAPFAASGRLKGVWEWDLDAATIASASGLLLTMHLDQTRAMAWRDNLEAMLGRGGRILVNGHVARPFISGLTPFVLCGRKREHFKLTVLGEHAVFDGVDRLALETRRGVAGFYGRGHNPPPDGARALTGIGPQAAPLDWVWHRTDGGTVLSHAGNDLWMNTEDAAQEELMIANALRWLAGETEA
jgi:hypothetical protein